MPELVSWASAGVALLAALSGSLHCVAMCGPMRLLAPSSASAGLQYQLGRLVAYLALGSLAGYLGEHLPWWASGAAVALFLLGYALSWRGPETLRRWRTRLLSASAARPWTLGLTSGLLPCGLLHGWMLVAVASGSALHGGAILFVLWLGTVPALELSSRLLGGPLRMLRGKFPRALPIALLLLALAPFGFRLHQLRSAPPEAGAAAGHCHHHSPTGK